MLRITYQELEEEIRRAFPVVDRLSVERPRFRAIGMSGTKLRQCIKNGGVSAVTERLMAILPRNASLTNGPDWNGDTVLYNHQLKDEFFVIAYSPDWPVVEVGASFVSNYDF